MKKIFFLLSVFSFLCTHAQFVSGLYSGTLVNDSTKKIQQYEFALSEYRDKITGYSYTTFVVNDTFYYSIKRIKATKKNNQLIIEDDKMLANNFPESPAKKVKQTSTIILNTPDTLVNATGKWTTNQTKVYYSLHGLADAKRNNDSSRSPLIGHLKELKIINPNETQTAVAKIKKPDDNRSGKTEILHALEKRGEKIIDLEKLASHKGSAFGNINMPKQPTQEMFENLLAAKLWAMGKAQQAIEDSKPLDTHSSLTIHHSRSSHSPLTTHHSPIWFEDESQRIGLINIPPAFWQQIRQGPVYFFDIPFEERLKHITEEYGDYDKKILAESIKRIGKRLGGLETKNALNYLEEGNIPACFSILLKYYDKHYRKGLHNRDNLSSLLQKLPCIAVDTNNAAMLITHSIPV
jgi:hypothetical protein